MIVDISSPVPVGKKIINGYKDGSFIVDTREYCSSIVISSENVIEFNELNINYLKHYELFLTKDIEYVLVGTGKIRIKPCVSVKHYLMQYKNIKFEFMSTDSACRTYNILLLEDRLVIAYLVVI
ncbi:Mth938-like domain-containing protein [Wolbachia endosymbiont of Pentidionis agamae]|uniref:Mth938-like domain-containing protein n=1 Tax=Wolbachia endosymbiont of Pentidionis agamae TaxID=3110435 RepID=UPI002FCEDAD6